MAEARASDVPGIGTARRLIDLTDLELRALVREEIAAAVAPNPNARAWMTSEECAELLGVDVRTIPSYVARGMPCDQETDGRRLRFHRDEVLAWDARRLKRRNR